MGEVKNVVYEAADRPRPSLCHLAGLWRRFVSLSVDLLILALFGWAIASLSFTSLALLDEWGRPLGFCILLVYFGLQESKLAGGQTIGDRLCHIRVVNRDGRRISESRSFLRTAIWGVPYILFGPTTWISHFMDRRDISFDILFSGFFFAMATCLSSTIERNKRFTIW